MFNNNNFLHAYNESSCEFDFIFSTNVLLQDKSENCGQTKWRGPNFNDATVSESWKLCLVHFSSINTIILYCYVDNFC